MFFQQITIPQWLSLEPKLRWKLKALFDVPRSQGVTVVDNRVVSDGHTHEDLKVISLEKVNAYLGTEEADFYTGLAKVIDKLLAEEQEVEEKEAERQHEERLAALQAQREATLDAVSKLLSVTLPPDEVKKAPKSRAKVK